MGRGVKGSTGRQIRGWIGQGISIGVIGCTLERDGLASLEYGSVKGSLYQDILWRVIQVYGTAVGSTPLTSSPSCVRRQ